MKCRRKEATRTPTFPKRHLLQHIVERNIITERRGCSFKNFFLPFYFSQLSLSLSLDHYLSYSISLSLSLSLLHSLSHNRSPVESMTRRTNGSDQASVLSLVTSLMGAHSLSRPTPKTDDSILFSFFLSHSLHPFPY